MYKYLSLSVGILLLSLNAFADSLSPSSIVAGKSVVPKILDSLSNDITSQYTLFYNGNELKISTFAGKQVIIGSIAGTYQVDAINNANVNNSEVFSLAISAGTAAQISISSGNNQSKMANQLSDPLIVEVKDSFGNSVSGVPVVFLVNQGSSKFGGQSSITINSDSNGLASTALALGSVSERNLVNVSISVSGISKQVSFVENSIGSTSLASKLAFATSPTTVTANSPFSIKVNAETSLNQLDSTFSGAVSVAAYKNSSCTIAADTALSGSLSSNANSGSATFSGILSTAQSLYLKVSSTGLTSACSQLIAVLPASTGLAKLKIIQLPTLLKPSQNLFPAVRVELLDNNSLLMNSQSSTVSVKAYSDALCSIELTTELSNNSILSINGFSTFPGLQSQNAGTIYLKASSGSISSDCSSALVVSGLSSPPTLSDLIDQTIQAKNSVVVQTHAVDPNGLALSYSFVSIPPIAASISNTGNFSWNPQVTNIGSYAVTIKVANSLGLSAQKSFNLNVIPSVVLSSLTFTEGDVDDPIIEISVQSNKQVSQVSFDASLYTNFTPISVQSISGANSLTTGLTQNTSLVSVPANTGVIDLAIAGSVKFSVASTSLNFTLMNQDGSSQQYSFPISIASNSLPYIRYDIFGVDNGAYIGGDVSSLFISAQEYKRLTAGWRTPILMRYREGPISCNGTQVPGEYQDTDSTIIACLKTVVSADAETVFSFSHIFSGTTELGGIAKGLRNGVVVQEYPFTHTLSHELGHNFGLFHTFETAFNPTVIDSSTYTQYPLMIPTLGSDTRSYPNDFSNNIISLSGSSPYTFNIADDTPMDFWNGVYYKLTTACVFGYCPSSPYVSGDNVLISEGGEGYDNQSSYVCQEAYNSTIGNYQIACNANAGITPDQSSVVNVMSYWLRADGTSVFTNGQKTRMDTVLNANPAVSGR